MAPTSNGMRRALRRASDGVTLDRAEAAVLLEARGDDLATLMATAAAVRDAGLLRQVFADADARHGRGDRAERAADGVGGVGVRGCGRRQDDPAVGMNSAI